MSAELDQETRGSLGKQVLIVDDDPVHRIMIKEFLGLFLDAAVSMVESGEQAIEHVISHPTDLILIDIQLPGMSGADAAGKIRLLNQSRAMSIIALTAFSQEEVLRKGLADHMDAVLTKPISFPEFRGHVTARLLA